MHFVKVSSVIRNFYKFLIQTYNTHALQETPFVLFCTISGINRYILCLGIHYELELMNKGCGCLYCQNVEVSTWNKAAL